VKKREGRDRTHGSEVEAVRLKTVNGKPEEIKIWNSRNQE
jgi:hypothetical protein